MKKRDFLKELNDKENVFLFDGAMGTSLYARGIYINRCFDELKSLNTTILPEAFSSTSSSPVAFTIIVFSFSSFITSCCKLSPRAFGFVVKVESTSTLFCLGNTVTFAPVNKKENPNIKTNTEKMAIDHTAIRDGPLRPLFFRLRRSP